MPYLCAVFDSATQAVIAQAAARFADNSPFSYDKGDDTPPFHIPLIGGLHVYSQEEIDAAVNDGGALTSAPVEGRFLRWAVSTKGTLRIHVELASHDGLAHMSSKLPRGREWRDELYVEVGSLAAIDQQHWDNFVDAAATAFPITETSAFSVSHVSFIEGAKRQKIAAKPRKPVGKRRTPGKPHPVSTHRKWERPGVAPLKTSVASMDTDTGHTGPRRVNTIGKKTHTSRGPLARR